MHPAIRTLREGRGHGITEIPVVDVALVGTGKTWHVIEAAGVARLVCGTFGPVHSLETDVQPQIVRFKGRTLCGRCVKGLGTLPVPERVG